MNNYQLWAYAISPDSSKFIADYFWTKLEPDWARNLRSSPWVKYETRVDWSAEALFEALAEIGLKPLTAGGSCPVEVEARLPTGQNLYFRARGQDWHCEIRELGFCRYGSYGQEPFSAGYMPLSEVFKRIEESLTVWGFSFINAA